MHIDQICGNFVYTVLWSYAWRYLNAIKLKDLNLRPLSYFWHNTHQFCINFLMFLIKDSCLQAATMNKLYITGKRYCFSYHIMWMLLRSCLNSLISSCDDPFLVFVTILIKFVSIVRFSSYLQLLTSCNHELARYTRLRGCFSNCIQSTLEISPLQQLQFILLWPFFGFASWGSISVPTRSCRDQTTNTLCDYLVADRDGIDVSQCNYKVGNIGRHCHPPHHTINTDFLHCPSP